MKALLRLQWLNYIMNPFAIMFQILMPIGISLIIGFTMGKDRMINVGNSNVPISNYWFPLFTIFIILVNCFNSIPIQLSSDRKGKLLKQISLTSITPIKYIASMFIISYCSFFIIWLICLTFAYGLFGMNISFLILILVGFILPLLAFIINFLISIIIGTNTNEPNKALAIGLILMYLFVFASGSIIPIYTSWFKYIQYLTPTGNICLLITNITMQADIKEIIIPFIILVIFTLLVFILTIKTFKWQ